METHIGIGIGKIIEKKMLSAESEILICSPMISPSIAKKLIVLIKKGVKIRIITSESSTKEDEQAIKILKEKSLKKYNGILELKVVDFKQAALIHAKIYIIDNKFVITGSANLTEKSFFKVPEYIVIQKDENEIKQITNNFIHLWNNYKNESWKYATKKRIKNLIKKINKT